MALAKTSPDESRALSVDARGLGRISAVLLYLILFAALLTAGMAVFRIGLQSTAWPGVCALAAFAFTLAVPTALLSCLSLDRASLESLLGPVIAVGLLLFLGLSFLGQIGTILVFAGALLACLRLVLLARHVVTRPSWWAVPGLLAIFIAYFVCLGGTRYNSFVADFLTLGGRASADVYFHWSITNALRYFGAVAIGIDGLVDLKYYPLAHLIAARIAEMSGGETGLTFIFVRAVFMTPFCLAAWALATLSVDREQAYRPVTLAFLSLLLVFFYSSYSGNVFFDSESHIVGLALFGLMAPSALNVLRAKLPARVTVAVWLGMLLCLALATSAKATTGFIILCVLGYVALRSYYRRPLILAVLWIASAGIAYGIYRNVISSESVGTLNASIAENFGLDQGWYAPFLHYSMAVLALLALIVAARASGSIWPQLKAGKIPLLELLGVVLIASTLPALVVPVPAGGGYYMTHPQMWIALPIVAAIGAPLLWRAIASLRQRNVPRAAMGLALAAVLVAITLIRTPDFFMDRVEQMVSQSTFARTNDPSYFASRKRKAVAQDTKRALPLMRTAAYYWPQQRPFLLDNLVQEIDALRVTHGTRLAAYVSPQAADFWTLTDNCFISSMMVFGMTGVPLVDGLPPLSTGCAEQQTVSYGFSNAGRRSSDVRLDDAQLCQLAKDRHFDVIARIEDLSKISGVVTCNP